MSREPGRNPLSEIRISRVPNGILVGLAVAMTSILSAGPLFAASPPVNLLARPLPQNQRLEVKVGLFVAELVNIDEVSERANLEGYLSLSWKDPRVSFSPGASDDRIHHFKEGELWMPHLEVANAVAPRQRYAPAGLRTLAVSFDGTVRSIERFNLAVATNFKLRRFPFDSQRIDIAFEPFPSETQNLTLMVDRGLTAMSDRQDVGLAQWQLGEVSGAVERINLMGQSYSQVDFSIPLKRHSAFYLYKVMLPLGLLALLAFAAFWIDVADIRAQTGVTVTAFLTAVAFALATARNLPPIPYLTFIDCVFLNSYIFIFAANVCLIGVNFIYRRDGDTGARLLRFGRWILPLGYLVATVFVANHFLSA